MKHPESKLQQNCVRWFRLQYPKYILFAIPNGGKRNVITASILKAEGVVAGIPDLFLAQPSLHYSGLFVEMKSTKGRLSDNQKAVIPKLELNYKVVICNSFDSFKEQINLYLS
jgi:hypothetical protein